MHLSKNLRSGSDGLGSPPLVPVVSLTQPTAQDGVTPKRHPWLVDLHALARARAWDARRHWEMATEHAARARALRRTRTGSAFALDSAEDDAAETAAFDEDLQQCDVSDEDNEEVRRALEARADALRQAKERLAERKAAVGAEAALSELDASIRGEAAGVAARGILSARPKLWLLDRDGCINEDVGAPGVVCASDLRLIPGAAGAVRRLRLSAKVAIVTNQSARGKGLLSAEELDRRSRMRVGKKGNARMISKKEAAKEAAMLDSLRG